MPTEIPTKDDLRLPWPDVARFLWLILRARRLSWQMAAADRRTSHEGVDGRAGAELLRIARTWLDCQSAIARLLQVPEPPHVAKVRAALETPKSIDAD